MELSVTSCYALAWRSFSKWWIPLCMVSGMVVVFHVVPRLLVGADMTEMRSTVQRCVTAAQEGDLGALESISADMTEQTCAVMGKLAVHGLYLFPAMALLTVILLMYANWAVKDRRDKRAPPLSLAYIGLVHVVLAIAKLLAFFLLILPGVYLYIKLLFVSLIMLEEKKSAGEAVQMSWQMTQGNFGPLFLLVLINTGIQLLVLPTIIGEIPVTAFANTSRAAAFRMILDTRAQSRRRRPPQLPDSHAHIPGIS